MILIRFNSFCGDYPVRWMYHTFMPWPLGQFTSLISNMNVSMEGCAYHPKAIYV